MGFFRDLLFHVNVTVWHNLIYAIPPSLLCDVFQQNAFFYHRQLHGTSWKQVLELCNTTSKNLQSNYSYSTSCNPAPDLPHHCPWNHSSFLDFLPFSALFSRKLAHSVVNPKLNSIELLTTSQKYLSGLSRTELQTHHTSMLDKCYTLLQSAAKYLCSEGTQFFRISTHSIRKQLIEFLPLLLRLVHELMPAWFYQELLCHIFVREHKFPGSSDLMFFRRFCQFWGVYEIWAYNGQQT